MKSCEFTALNGVPTVAIFAFVTGIVVLGVVFDTSTVLVIVAVPLVATVTVGAEAASGNTPGVNRSADKIAR
jgi:hypothetical protein